MIRKHIQLTEHQSRRLKTLATRQGICMTELIRRAIDQVIDAEQPIEDVAARSLALSIVGKYSDDAADVSEQHDRYLGEAFQL